MYFSTNLKRLSTVPLGLIKARKYLKQVCAITLQSAPIHCNYTMTSPHKPFNCEYGTQLYKNSYNSLQQQ
jgi:hypothetical protein